MHYFSLQEGKVEREKNYRNLTQAFLFGLAILFCVSWHCDGATYSRECLEGKWTGVLNPGFGTEATVELTVSSDGSFNGTYTYSNGGGIGMLSGVLGVPDSAGQVTGSLRVLQDAPPYYLTLTLTPSGRGAQFDLKGSTEYNIYTFDLTGGTPCTTSSTTPNPNPNPAPDPIVSIEILPNARQVRVGEIALFQLWGRTAAGELRSVPLEQWSVSGGGTISERGIFTASEEGGPFVVTALSEGQSYSASVTVAVNAPPEIVSAITVIPSAPSAQSPIIFQAIATDVDNEQLFYRWDFGDDSTAIGQNPVHAFDRMGKYTVTLEVTDGHSIARSNLDVSVSSSAAIQPRLFVKGFNARLNFKKTNRDTLKIRGVLQPFTMTSMEGIQVVLNVGEVRVPFTLNARGKEVNEMGSFSISEKLGAGIFRVTLRKGSFQSRWKKEGVMDSNASGHPIALPVTLEWPAVRYQAVHTVTYKAKVGRGGILR